MINSLEVVMKFTCLVHYRGITWLRPRNRGVYRLRADVRSADRV